MNTPDGWVLALGGKDEKHVPVAPLTTALSSREYLSSGIFGASLTGPEPLEASSRSATRSVAGSTRAPPTAT
ncbi:mspA family protein [Mycobacterium kansasii 824]|nr:mspA family protein [Mycobacterium kansasii 824]